MRPSTGQVYGERYELVSRIAIGGMGEVWRATDTVIGRTVAIKILKEEYLGDPGFRERFRAEARHAALVNHEGIANVFDYGEEEGNAYLVMEMVPGEALSTVLERERVLPPERVLSIVSQTAAALHQAHQAGLVHRDIKPGNLLITPDGTVKITDFGIARVADQVPLTATGQVMGTVQYLAPEQASGKPASPATDIYSLGIVAYEALAGRRPFRGESQVSIAMAHIKEAPPELPVTIPEPVRQLVMSCLAKKPEARPANADDLAKAARALARGDIEEGLALLPDPHQLPDSPTAVMGGKAPGTGPTNTQPIPIVKKAIPKNLWLLAGGAAVTLIAIVIGSIALINSRISPEEIVQPEAPAEEVIDTTVEPEITEPDTTLPEPEPVVPEQQVTTVVVPEADILGKSQNQAQDLLTRAGLRLDAITGNVAPSQDLVGTAYRVNPRGTVKKDTLISVYFYAAIPTPAAPQAISIQPPAGPYAPGQEVTLSWPAYAQCPSGFPLSGYQVTLSSAQPINPNTLSLNNTTTALTVKLGESGTARASYTVTCQALASPSSAELAITIEAPVEPEE